MHKSLRKGLLLIGILFFGGVLLHTRAQQTTGELKLEITAGQSCCVYGTSVVFGEKDVSFGITEFSGDFLSYNGTTSWGCKDLLGTETGWAMYIAMSGDMENQNGNKIGSGNVKISFDETTLVGGNCIPYYTSGTDISLNTGVVLFEKDGNTSTNYGKICELGTTNVQLKVVTNTGQAPGNYVGTLVIDLPSFASSNCDELEGTFYDAETDGLNYEGDQGSMGITSNGGKFSYKPGEQITFKVGTVTLGNPVTPATNGSVFVTDLFGLARTEITDTNVIKVAKLLQGLDEDNNPDNGISISGAIATSFTENNNITALDVDAKLTSLNNPIRTNTQIVQHLKNTAVTKLDQELNIDFSWVKTGTWLDNDIVKGIIADGSGNTYIIGTFGYTGFFGTTTLVPNNKDIYIAKVDKDGNWLRAINGGGTGPETLRKMAIDKYGNVYIIGTFGFKYDKTFGTTTLVTDLSNVYIAKLDKDGNWLRAKQQDLAIDGITYDIVHSSVGGITIDNLGNIYAVSSFRSILGTGTDLYISKLDKDGNWLRAKNGGGISQSYAYAELITVDSLGNSYIAGDFSGTIILGGTTLVSDGQNDAYIAKMDTNGNWLRARKSGGIDENTDYIAVKGMTIDKLNNNYFVGSFSGTVTFGTTTLVSDGQNDAYIAKIDSDGNWLRARKGGGEYADSIKSIIVDTLGNCHIVGTFQGTGVFGANILINSFWSDESIFIAKMDTNGNWISSNIIEGLNSKAIFIDDFKNVYIVGMFYNGLLGIGLFDNIGIYENLIYKIASRNINEKLRGSTPEEGDGEM